MNFVNPLFISSYVDIPQKGGYVTPLGTAAIDYHVKRPINVLSPVSAVLSPSSPLSSLSTIVSPLSSVKSSLSISSKGTKYNLGTLKNPISSSNSESDLELTISTPRRYSTPIITHPHLNPYPTYELNHYKNVNSDPDLLRKVTKYFYEKTMNKWILSDFEYLLSYLIIKNNEVKLVKTKSEQEKNKKELETNKINMKIEFIANYVFTKYDMKSFVKKFAIKANLDLWDLEKNRKYVKKALYKKIKNRLEKIAFHI